MAIDGYQHVAIIEIEKCAGDVLVRSILCDRTRSLCVEHVSNALTPVAMLRAAGKLPHADRIRKD